MARFKKFPVNGHEGRLVYGDGIVDDIVKLAIDEIPNVDLDYSHPVIHGEPAKVVFERDGVHVDVSVVIHFMQSVSEIAFKIQEAVRYNVESMTEFHVANVNVLINGVSFADVDDKASVLIDEQDEQEKQEG